VRHAVDHHAAHAADALAAIVVEGDRVVAVEDQLSLSTSSISRNDAVRRDVLDVVTDHAALVAGPGLAPHPYLDVHYFELRVLGWTYSKSSASLCRVGFLPSGSAYSQAAT